MGCCGNSTKYKYQIDGKNKTIAVKDAEKINKIGRQAVARIRVKELIIENAKGITSKSDILNLTCSQ
jgi:hypothetical protein